jgi:adenylate cyclase
VAVPSVTAIVVGLRSVGLLQLIEFPVLDQFFVLRPAEPTDARIVIVEVNESDVQKSKQWPLNDADLAQVLQNIKQQQPKAIGLDLYRDLPVQPGSESLTQLFETTPNLIGVQKVGQTADSAAVAPPTVLKQRDQVGMNDLPLDNDGKIRRGFLYASDGQQKTIFSFGFRLAALYLEAQKIQPELTPDNQVRLGKAVFPALEANDGAYVGAESGGYRVLLNYRSRNDQFVTITLTEVLENRIPLHLFRDRIVLIGSTAESLKDLFYVPYSSSLTTPTRMPGVMIHANLVSQILSAVLDNRPLLRTWSDPIEFAWILGWAATGAIITWRQRFGGGSLMLRLWNLSSVVLLMVCLVAIAFIAFLEGWWIPVVPAIMALVSSALGITGYVAWSAADMRRTFGRYLTDEVVASLLETPSGLEIGGQRRKVTVLVSDLRGFSAISERLPPEEVVQILNFYLAAMSDTIGEYKGTINEFIGDGIFVLFGAPIQRPDDSCRAIACAIAMQNAMLSVNQHNQRLGLPTLEMGIGINTGEMVVGNIGSQKRAKYTVIGSHANLAARIESYTVGGQVLISEYTVKDAATELTTIGQMRVQPKGIKKPLTLHDIQGIGDPYGVCLPEEVEAFVTLDPPIVINYIVLEGKHLVGTVFHGELVRLSANSAEIRSTPLPTPLNNLKLTLLLPREIEAIEDLYAKVIDKPTESADCARIRFTGMLPEVAQILARARGQ